MLVTRILHRVDQFRRAVFASVGQQELDVISKVLSPVELELFMGMSVVDQRHSLDVYYTSLKILEKFPDADPILTKKAVQLHELGKSRFKNSLLDRVLATLPKNLVKAVFPWKVEHVFNYKYLHPLYSAEMVVDDRIRDWVKVHYERVHEQDPPELKVLKISDSLN